MCKYIYYLLTTSKLGKVDLFNALETAKKYGKVVDNDEYLFVGADRKGVYRFNNSFNDPETPFFIHLKDTPEIHCVFYRNLFLTFTHDNKNGDRVIRGYMKRPDDEWEFSHFDTTDGCDLLSPINVCAEVYNAYDVNVLNLTRAHGENYISGTWNKMFYGTLVSFLEKVDEYTEVTRLNKAYKKKNQAK